MHNNINRIIAFFVFLVSLYFYWMTLPPTVTFWDVGEFCAAGYLLQVPHPPGAPLFLLFLRLASMIPISEDIAVRMHFFSSFVSAISVGFTYLIIVRIIEIFRGKSSEILDKLIVYSSAVIGAFSLAFSFSYWFNAVEAEVYATGSLFATLIIWLAFVWYEKSNEQHNESYLFLIAYLVGISAGIHLGAVLMLFGVLTLYFFRKAEIITHSKNIGIILGSLALAGFSFMLLGSTEAFGWIGVLILIAFVFVLANYVSMKSFIIFVVSSVAIFFSIYAGIILGLPKILVNKSGIFITGLSIIIALFCIYHSVVNKKKFLHLISVSFVLILIGYSTYSLVIIRSNVPNMPMNENQPDDLNGLVRYISREQYGEQPKFMPRRWSQESHQQGIYENYKSDFDFMWKYQIDNMFNRYLEWNFIGREGDYQDGGVKWGITFGLPFFIGLFGLFYHFKKDWKTATTIFTLFLVSGVILALYQNQQQPQPRERDYFYTEAFFVFSIWIGIGVMGIIDYSILLFKEKSFVSVSLPIAFCLFVVPFNMAKMNLKQSSRAGNYVAWDYSYNILQSCPKDALLVTNGDNDTFPLWYLQDVEGIRTDVRIVNLSLVNTDWYIKQLKNNTPHGAKKVKISFSDEEIEQLQPQYINKSQSIPVSNEIVKKFAKNFHQPFQVDSSIIKNGEINFEMSQSIPAQPNGNNVAVRVQDVMMRNIIVANNWERPIIFAVTCSPDSKIGLDKYLWYQGLGWELKPLSIPNGDEGIDLEMLRKRLITEIKTSSKEPQFGYLYRNLNNKEVTYEENQKRMLQNYRTAFLRLAIEEESIDNLDGAKRAVQKMEKVMPRNVIEMDWRLMSDVKRILDRIGEINLSKNYKQEIEKKCFELIEEGKGLEDGNYSAIRVLLSMYVEDKEYKKGIALLKNVKLKYPSESQQFDAFIKQLEQKQ